MMQIDSPLREGVILLVDIRWTMLRRFGDALQRAGYDVVQAASFDDAKQALTAHRPQLVVTSLRLAAFNGLHLIHLGKLANPDLGSIIVLASASDLVLKDEADNLHARLLVEPVSTQDLLSLVADLIGDQADGRSIVAPGNGVEPSIEPAPAIKTIA